MRGAVLKKTIAWAFVALVLVIVYMPIIVLVIYSFIETRAGAFERFSFSAYADMFQDSDLWPAIWHTFVLAIGSSLIATIFGTFTAIGLFNMKKRSRQVIGAANQITVVNADIVTAVAFSLLILSINKIIRNIGLEIPEGWFTLMTAHVMITTPYVILAVLPRLRQLNPNVYEAALDLGAGPWKATIRVLIPQLVGAMIAGFALSFTLSLDDFVITKHNGGDVGTISTLLYDTLKYKGVPNSYRALSTILFVIILAVLIIINVMSAKREKNNKKTINK